MGRRQTGGVVGNTGFSAVFVDDTTISTAELNDDLTIDPNGTGIVQFDTDVQIKGQQDLRFADSDSSNYVGFQAPATISSNVTWTLPSADGSNGQALVTNGSATLSWGSLGVSVTNNTIDASTYYPTFTTTTSGSLSGLVVSSSKLTFQPSTGTLTATIVNGTSGTIATFGSTTGTFTTLNAGTINETSSIALKENINPITGALEKILNLKAYTYDRKDGTSKDEAGLIAEEVEEIIPNIVSKDLEGNPHYIQYSKITAYLVEAIKSLKKEIDELKAR